MSILKQSWLIVLYEQNFNIGEEISLAGDEFHYLTRVLRLKENDSIELSNGIGSTAFATISAIQKNFCQIIINTVTDHDKKRAVHLMLANLKPNALEDSVFTASELGIDTIHLFKSERADSKQAIKLEKLQKISNEAIRISKSGFSAKIFQYNSLEECINGIHKQLNNVHFLFCDEESKLHIKNAPHNNFENTCIIIGPEASFSLSERSKILSLKNCIPVSLGNRILRASTAVTCACFIICHSGA